MKRFSQNNFAFCIGIVAVLAPTILANVFLSSFIIPYVNGDSMFFLPQIVSHRAGNGLTNPFYDLALSYSPAHDGRQIWHGFLFQLLTSGLMWDASYQSLLRALRMIDGATFVVMSMVFFSIYKMRSGSKRLGLLLGGMLAMLGFSLGLQGRPETLSLLIYALAGIAILLRRPNGIASFLGVLSALNLLVSPLQGIFSAFACVLYYYISCNNIGGFIKAIAVCSLVGAFVTIVGLMVFPYGSQELLNGIRQHSVSAIRSRHVVGGLLATSWRDLLFQTGHFFAGGLLIILAFYFFVVMRAHKNRFAGDRYLLAALLSGALVVLVYYFRASGWYALTALSPLVIYLGWSIYGSGGSIGLLIIPLVFFSMGIDAVMHVGARLVVPSQQSWVSARAVVGKVERNEPGVAVSTRGVFLVDVKSANDILEYEQFQGHIVRTNKPYFILVQDWTTRIVPKFDNYSLIYSDMKPSNSIPVSRIDQWFGEVGFSIAIYKRSN